MSMPCKIAVALTLSAALGACQPAQNAPTATGSPPAPKAAGGETATKGGGTAPASALVEYLNPDTHFDSPAFSQIAVVANRGKTFYISGQIPVDAKFELLAKDDLRGQTKAVLNNLDMALKAAGITRNDVVKINVGVVSKEARDSFIVSEELMMFFARPEMPATTMSGMPYIVADGILVQVDATAVTD